MLVLEFIVSDYKVSELEFGDYNMILIMFDDYGIAPINNFVFCFHN